MRSALSARPDIVDPDVTAPVWLPLPLRERIRRIGAGELSAADWRAQADAWSRTADEAYRACVELRPVDPGGGPIRIGVKDTIDVAGFATRLGLASYRRYPRRSAAALGGLPAAAVTAKTVSAQLGLGLEHHCRNPRFPHLNPSGSSTGSAVAVASGVCDIAVGTDSSASIRLPANACGVTGLRVTHDRRHLDGVFALSTSLDAPGWLARTPDDLAFAWDRFGLGRPVGHPSGRRYRIGVGMGLLTDGCLPGLVDTANAVAGRLRDAGHTITGVDLGDLLPWRAAVWELVARDACDRHRDFVEDLGDEVSDSVRQAFAFGAGIDDARRAQIVHAMQLCRADVSERFARDGVDAWLLPTTSRFPRPTGRDGATSTVPDFTDPATLAGLGYATLASFAGLPAITVPATIDPVHRAPIGVQLLGPPHSEPMLIDIARRVAAVAEIEPWTPTLREARS